MMLCFCQWQILQKWGVFQRSKGLGHEKFSRGQAPGPPYLLASLASRFSPPIWISFWRACRGLSLRPIKNGQVFFCTRNAGHKPGSSTNVWTLPWQSSQCNLGLNRTVQNSVPSKFTTPPMIFGMCAPVWPSSCSLPWPWFAFQNEVFWSLSNA